MTSTSSPVLVASTCTSCKRGLELTCEGISGVAGYRTFNEFFCPACRKQNHALTPGAIVSVRATT